MSVTARSLFFSVAIVLLPVIAVAWNPPVPPAQSGCGCDKPIEMSVVWSESSRAVTVVNEGCQRIGVTVTQYGPDGQFLSGRQWLHQRESIIFPAAFECPMFVVHADDCHGNERIVKAGCKDLFSDN